MNRVTFLGTGDYLASERYWNGFVIDGSVLVEPSPAVVPHMRRCGLNAADVTVVVISHFHADHTFGWPFLVLELIRLRGRGPVFVVGPPGVEGRLSAMMDVGGVAEVRQAAQEHLDLRFVEVNGSWQEAGPLRLRAVEVEHVPYLDCYGYLFDLDGRVLAYSGDTRPCDGLEELARSSDTLILECNGPHPPPLVHMNVDEVLAVRRRHPDLHLVLTHLGPGVDASAIDDCVVPDDFQVLDL